MGGKLEIPSIRTQAAVLYHQYVIETDTIYRIGRDSHWQQFSITHILNNAVHWFHSLYNAPSWFDNVDKKPSVKTDLAI